MAFMASAVEERRAAFDVRMERLVLKADVAGQRNVGIGSVLEEQPEPLEFSIREGPEERRHAVFADRIHVDARGDQFPHGRQFVGLDRLTQGDHLFVREKLLRFPADAGMPAGVGQQVKFDVFHALGDIRCPPVGRDDLIPQLVRQGPTLGRE